MQLCNFLQFVDRCVAFPYVKTAILTFHQHEFHFNGNKAAHMIWGIYCQIKASWILMKLMIKLSQSWFRAVHNDPIT